MLVHLIELCYRLGLSTFDLGMGSEPYKFQFVRDTCALHSLTLCHATPGGVLAHLWFNLARNQLRRIDRLRSFATQWRRASVSRRTASPSPET
jgi:CelD/BcsL family acetyltransferase involved in cellulose biosynthesis